VDLVHVIQNFFFFFFSKPRLDRGEPAVGILNGGGGRLVDEKGEKGGERGRKGTRNSKGKGIIQ
jgi:hypothetical protein